MSEPAANRFSVLKSCNCFVQYGEGPWLPAIVKDNDSGLTFMDPRGLSISMPSLVRPATATQIADEMYARGEVPL